MIGAEGNGDSEKVSRPCRTEETQCSPMAPGGSAAPGVGMMNWSGSSTRQLIRPPSRAQTVCSCQVSAYPGSRRARAHSMKSRSN